MPTDAQILAAGTAAAPLDYTVPNAAEFELLVVAGNFDGSGAASPFLPAVVIESDGHVPIARAITDSAVAAGGSAEVSFFPGVKHAASGATSTGLSACYVQASPLGVVGPGAVFPTWTAFITNDAATFSLNPADHRMIHAATDGVFLAVLALLFTVQPTSLQSSVTMGARGFDALPVVASFVPTNAISVLDATAADPKEVTELGGTAIWTGGAVTLPWSFYAEIDLGAATNLSAASMHIVRLSTVIES